VANDNPPGLPALHLAVTYRSLVRSVVLKPHAFPPLARMGLAAAVRTLGKEDALAVGLLAVVIAAPRYDPDKAKPETFVATTAAYAILNESKKLRRRFAYQLSGPTAASLPSREGEPRDTVIVRDVWARWGGSRA
jgi:Sigma-70 region 2